MKDEETCGPQSQRRELDASARIVEMGCGERLESQDDEEPRPAA